MLDSIVYRVKNSVQTKKWVFNTAQYFLKLVFLILRNCVKYKNNNFHIPVSIIILYIIYVPARITLLYQQQSSSIINEFLKANKVI